MPDLPDNAWTRHGASGAVPMPPSGARAGTYYREVQPLTHKELAALMERAVRTWKRRQPVVRETIAMRSWGYLGALDGKIATDLMWISDFFDPESPLYEPFEREFAANARLIPGTDENLHAALAFLTLKTLQKSDTPCWFQVSEGLAWNLATTDLKGVYPEDVRMPHEGFYIELPEGMLTLTNNITGEHTVRALGLAEGCPAHNPRVEVPTDVAHGYGRRLLLVAFCEPNEESLDPTDDNVMYLSLPLFDDSREVDAMLAQDAAAIEATGGDWRDEKMGGSFAGVRRSNKELRGIFQRLALNVLLYMNSEEAEVEHAHAQKIRRLKQEKKGAKKYKAQIAKLKAEPTFLVGTSVKLDPRVKRAAAEETGRKGRTVRVKSLVRGHWRNQAHGPGRTLRRKMWIRPHVRGEKAVGRVLGHNYEMEGKRER